MFTDTHAHIFKEYYDDFNKVIKDAKENGVNKIIVAATNIKECVEIISTSKAYNEIYYCLGIHPDSIDNDIADLENIIEKNKDDEKFVAIGEIGLDYHYGKENKEKQIELFEAQLDLAEKFNKPVIIHSRDATEDTINILKKYKLKGVIHSFSGSYETACIYIKMGFLLGINGVITFKNCNLKDAVNRLSLDNIILETDSPYLAPVPYRGKQNNPSHIIDIARFIAELKGITLDELEKETNGNIRRIFDI